MALRHGASFFLNGSVAGLTNGAGERAGPQRSAVRRITFYA